MKQLQSPMFWFWKYYEFWWKHDVLRTFMLFRYGLVVLLTFALDFGIFAL